MDQVSGAHRRSEFRSFREVYRRIATRINTAWLKVTYPFAEFGRGISIDPSCNLTRSLSQYLALGDGVQLHPHCMLYVLPDFGPSRIRMALGRGCNIQRLSTIAAKNYIELEDNVLVGPHVFIVDYNHEYSDPDLPILAQGETEGGRIVIGRNSWIGYGSVVCCGEGQLTLGRNCVVAANSVVLSSFPDFSVVAGSPAKLIKSYDPNLKKWIRVRAEDSRSGLINV